MIARHATSRKEEVRAKTAGRGSSETSTSGALASVKSVIRTEGALCLIQRRLTGNTGVVDKPKIMAE